MRQDKLSKQNVILYFCGIIPVVWLGLLIAPCLKDGLPGLVQQFGSVMQNPFQIQLCEDSVKTVLTLLLVYGIAIGVYLSTEHNYRRREEHGSAKWGTAGSVNKKYANKDKTENKLLTQNVAIGLDGRKHRRNLNVLVCGGSGAGKTRFYAKPNIMNANTSFVVLDPKGELLRDTGHLLEENGYEIKVLDLIDMEKSHCYNPFVYLNSDDDIQRLTTNLFKNTTPKGSQTQDPFWDQTAAMLLKALVCYLHYEAPPDEQNFSMVMEMIRAGDVKEDNEEYSTNYQLAGRELMTPDEVRMLDNRYALLFIRGERPVRDLKYDILHHPNVALTTDGSAPAYTHGEDTRSIASMAFSFDKKAVKNAEKMEAEKHEFLLYSEEELEELLDEKEKKGNEET